MDIPSIGNFVWNIGSMTDPQKEGTGTFFDLVLPTMNGSNPTTYLSDSAGLTNIGQQNDAYKNATDVINGLLDQNSQVYGTVQDKIAENRDTIAELLGGDSAVSGYKDLLANFNADDFNVDSSRLSGYKYGKDVSDFMDPAAQYNIDQSVAAATNALAGQGGLSGGAAAKQLQAVASQAASSEYSKAYDRMTADKQQDYTQVKDALNVDQNNASRGMDAYKMQLEGAKGLFDQYIGNMDNASDDTINALLAQFNNESELKQNLAQMGIDKASQGSVVSQALGGTVGKIFSSIFG